MNGILAISIVFLTFSSHIHGQSYKTQFQNIDSVIPPLKTSGLFGSYNYGPLTAAASYPSLLTSDIFPAGSPIKSIFSRNPFLSAHSVFASPLTRFFKSPLYNEGYSNTNHVLVSSPNNVAETFSKIASYPQPNSYGPTGEYPHTRLEYPMSKTGYQDFAYLRPDHAVMRSNYPHVSPNYPNVISHFAVPSLEPAPTPFNLDSPQPPKKFPSYGTNVFPAGVAFSNAPRTNDVHEQPRYQQLVNNEPDYDYDPNDDNYQTPVVHAPNQLSPSYGQTNMENTIKNPDIYDPRGKAPPSNYKLSLHGPPIIRYLTSSYTPPATPQKQFPDKSYIPRQQEDSESQPVEEEAVVYAGPLPKSNEQSFLQGLKPNSQYVMPNKDIPRVTYLENTDYSPNENYSPKLYSPTTPKPNIQTQSPQYISPQSVPPTPYEMVDYYDGTYPDTNSLAHQSDDNSKADLGYLKNQIPEETNEVSNDGHPQPIPLQDAPDGYEPVASDEFTCIGRTAGHYGDANHGCQVFHICQSDGRHDTFYCPKGTLFNKETNVCDFPYKSSGAC